MEEKLYLYPVWVRIWHMLNALLYLLLIFTGLSLQYSSTEFSLIPFNYAVTIHNIAGIVLLANYILFLAGNRFTSNGMYYQFHIKGMGERVMKQFKYYTFGVFKKEKSPFPITKDRKFNPLQKLTYAIVMYIFVPIILASGFGLFFPEILPDKFLFMSGIHFVDLVHIITGFGLSLFMVIHIYFCTFGKTPGANFKSMLNGWH